MTEPATTLLQRYDKPILSASLIVRLFLGGLFVYMGVNKIGHPVAFLKQIHLYDMLPVAPPQAMNLTAIALPWVEVICGLALILGLWRRGSAVLIALMLGVFTPAIFSRALSIHQTEGTPFLEVAFDCGCGAGVVVTWKKLLENSGLFVLAVMTILSRSQSFSLGRWLTEKFAPPRECARIGDVAPAAEGRSPRAPGQRDTKTDATVSGAAGSKHLRE